jgi:hypothetical protein
MIMKKLIAIAVVFALAVGGVFAADLGVNIIGTVNLLEGNTNEGSEITGSASLDRVRIEGAGENDDGTFGAWIRVEGAFGGYFTVPPSWHDDYKDGIAWEGDGFAPFGLAWWKPIDMFKLSIGGNPDGIYGKEGYAGWMFHQIVADTGVVAASQAWTCAYTLWGTGGAKFRDAFYGGFGGNALMLDIKPVDAFGLNLILPYFDAGSPKLAGVFKNMTIQADVNLDFGNIALTFDMSPWQDGADEKIGGKAYLYFGLSAIENLSLDFSVGFGLPQGDAMEPVAVGLAAKYNVSDAFGLKARVMASFGGKSWVGGDDMEIPNPAWDPDDEDSEEPETITIPGVGAFGDNPFNLIFEVLPFFSISDSMTVFADIGINMGMPKGGDSVIGFHFNPYIQVGNEWGPSFFAGVKVWTTGKAGDKTPVNFAIPIALHVSF